MVQQIAHSLPLLAFGGFEGSFKLFDTESLVILRELCVFSDMGGKETVSNLVSYNESSSAPNFRNWTFVLATRKRTLASRTLFPMRSSS